MKAASEKSGISNNSDAVSFAKCSDSDDEDSDSEYYKNKFKNKNLDLKLIIDSMSKSVLYVSLCAFSH